jgi:hypothetical protein
MARADNQSPIAAEIQSNYVTEIDYDGGKNPIYIGKAKPGTATSATTGWSIKKFTWDSNNNPTKLEWADATESFDKEWDNRAIYAYS